VSQKDQQAYVQEVLSLYRRLPDTPSRPRPADRRLAGKLYRRGVHLDVVEVAMRLAAGRRTARPTDADPLPPIRSLHYFLPVIDELPPEPPPKGYLDYLREAFPDKPTANRTVTPSNGRRRDRSPRRTSRQLRLPLHLGAGPKNDVSS
jgi:hypothetical protein